MNDTQEMKDELKKEEKERSRKASITKEEYERLMTTSEDDE